MPITPDIGDVGIIIPPVAQSCFGMGSEIALASCSNAFATAPLHLRSP